MITKEALTDYMKNVVFSFWNNAPAHLWLFAIGNCLVALMINRLAFVLCIATWAVFVPSAIYLKK